MDLAGMKAFSFARFNMVGKFLMQLTTDSGGWRLEENASRCACSQGINSALPLQRPCAPHGFHNTMLLSIRLPQVYQFAPTLKPRAHEPLPLKLSAPKGRLRGGSATEYRSLLLLPISKLAFSAWLGTGRRGGCRNRRRWKPFLRLGPSRPNRRRFLGSDNHPLFALRDLTPASVVPGRRRCQGLRAHRPLTDTAAMFQG